MILQSGTTPRLRKDLHAALSKDPSVIYVFPRQTTGVPDRVLTALQSSTVSNLDLRHVPLYDPTADSPWGEKEIATFKAVVEEAAALVKTGATVLFACVAGRNRSRVAAKCTAAIAGVDSSNLKMPFDEGCFAALMDAFASGDEEKVKQCAPVKPIRESRKRALP
tara:strand:- start:123 stop:617 length:495 start_codon:yes stop_codon:yes gene_type:complete